MAEDLYINAGSKTEKYRALLPQLKKICWQVKMT